MLFTAKLGLSKPENGPGVDDIVDSDVLAANFDLIDANIGTKTCTSSTRPDNGANGIRFTGQVIFETDTKAYGIWNGTAWRLFDTEWQTYTPTWSTPSNPQPVKGNGTLTGRYFRAGKKIDLRIELVGGSTTTFGTGVFTFSLPPGFNSRDQERVGLNCFLDDSSSGDLYWASFYWAGAASDGVCIYFKSVAAGLTNTSVDKTSPFTWATGDTLVIHGSYEAA